MDRFTTLLNYASQADIWVGVVVLLTAGGEHVFSLVVFRCPCSSDLNFVYGLAFLLVPALALLLLGYILNQRTWMLLTGSCGKRSYGWVTADMTTLLHITNFALVAPSSWIAVALLSGNYYECAMTGTNVSSYYRHLYEDASDTEQCQEELFRFPCGKGSGVSEADRNQVMLTLKAHSQILGWLLIASIMLFNLLLTCLGRCTSTISYLQLKFWRTYAQEENSLLNSYIVKHARELAERNLKSFFTDTPPEAFQTPTADMWKKIFPLFKFNSRKQHYSALHCYVEEHWKDQRVDMGIVEKSPNSGATNSAGLSFVNNGNTAL